jgi:large subunit ribosomal protein L22
MQIGDKSAQVLLRNIRVSPRKLNLVAQSIRGLKVDKAVNALQFSRKRIAVDVLKALRSAIANAEGNHGLDIDNLYVDQAFVGKGIMMRRFQARGRSRSGIIKKFFSQLRIVVSEETAEEGK